MLREEVRFIAVKSLGKSVANLVFPSFCEQLFSLISLSRQLSLSLSLFLYKKYIYATFILSWDVCVSVCTK